MYKNEQNEFGCPLRNQNGATAVKDFATLLAQLSPDLRADFERERAARKAEIEQFVEMQGYRT
jgi:hypothetical protein